MAEFKKTNGNKRKLTITSLLRTYKHTLTHSNTQEVSVCQAERRLKKRLREGGPLFSELPADVLKLATLRRKITVCSRLCSLACSFLVGIRAHFKAANSVTMRTHQYSFTYMIMHLICFSSNILRHKRSGRLF